MGRKLDQRKKHKVDPNTTFPECIQNTFKPFRAEPSETLKPVKASATAMLLEVICSVLVFLQ